MNTSNSKFKNIDELKAKMAAKNSGGAGGGFGGSSGGFGGGSSGGGFGGGFSGAKVPKKQQQVIIEEDDSGNRKMFEFDMNQTDKTLLPPKDRIKPIMVIAFTIVALVFGAFIGWCWHGVLADRQRVNDRIKIAQEVYPDINKKIDSFQVFAQRFRQRSESMGAGVLEYNEAFYKDVIKNYKDNSFVLDVSELPSATSTMASNAAQNPLSDLRGFGAGTTLLAALLDSHIEQTEKDLPEIEALLGKNSATDRNIVYAIKVDPAELFKLTNTFENKTNDDRQLPIIEAREVYQVKSAITDDAEAEKAFLAMHESGVLDEAAFTARKYTPPTQRRARSARAQAKPDEPLEDANRVLPRRLLYVIEDKDGKQQTVFSDQIILINRTMLFAGTATALDRYRKRMIQILALLGEIDKSTDGLQSRLHIISTEEPL